MYSITTAVAAILALTLTAKAQTISGQFTHYDIGLGACGETHDNTEMVAAISKDRFGPSTTLCGRKLRIHYEDKSAEVTIVDSCQDCSSSSLDLSPAAFTALVGSLEPGRVDGTWEFI
ncbi:Allergen Asp f 7 [Metarhizium anisopliae]|nr:Allergen Asp f 7 [Metarhizium anisopliae]